MKKAQQNDPLPAPIGVIGISENVSKKRRGRPSHSQEELAKAAQLAEHLGRCPRTLRGLQNYLHMNRANEVLVRGYKHEFRFLFKPEPKWTILAELGRISWPPMIQMTAWQICHEQMKARKAIALCRQMRDAGKPSIDGLKKAIQKAIGAYTDRQGEMHRLDIWQALWVLAFEYKDAHERRLTDAHKKTYARITEHPHTNNRPD